MALQGNTDHDLVPMRSSSSGPQLHKISQDQTSNENKPFRFLDLPPELRNMIYKIHIGEEGVFTITQGILSLTVPTLGVNLLRCCKQVYKEAAPYVKPSLESLALALQTPINDWHAWINFRTAFDARGHFRDLSSSMLVNVLKLRLDIPVCYSSTDHFRRPVAFQFPAMKHLRCIDVWFDLQGCSAQPYGRKMLIDWLHETSQSLYSHMVVTVRIHIHHKHDLASIPDSCVLAVSKDYTETFLG